MDLEQGGDLAQEAVINVSPPKDTKRLLFLVKPLSCPHLGVSDIDASACRPSASPQRDSLCAGDKVMNPMVILQFSARKVSESVQGRVPPCSAPAVALECPSQLRTCWWLWQGNPSLLCCILTDGL